MAIIRSGVTSDLLTIDPTSNAIEVVIYDASNCYRGVKKTLRAAPGTATTTATGVGAFFIISGCAAGIVKVHRLSVTSPSVTAAAYMGIVLQKLVSRPTGGTTVIVTAVPLDRAVGGSGPTLLQAYTAIPTPGVSYGPIGFRRLMLQTSATASAAEQAMAEWDFRSQGESGPVVLRGADEILQVNFSNTLASAATIGVEAEWTIEG